ncbi:MED23 [Mytilus coruscus]|uniref:MED23 n=1 Tax=Mytilus coruscus TaxID=42192 RepID=A0A6J8AE67_MYTCO|nr:MED23 [Mytilus coruscus]
MNSERNEKAFTEQEISTLVQTIERILPRFDDNPSAMNNDIIENELANFRKAASFESIAFAYNDLYVGQDWMLKSDTGALILDRHRLAEAWYKRAFISMKQRYCDESEIEFIASDHLENTLEKHVDQLWTSFTKNWSSHTDSCNHKVCSKALVLDGHMKGTRSVCAEKKSETKTSDELGDVVVGCKKKPAAGSIYCKKHASTVTKENPLNEDVKCPDEQVDDLRCNTRKDTYLVKKK